MPVINKRRCVDGYLRRFPEDLKTDGSEKAYLYNRMEINYPDWFPKRYLLDSILAAIPSYVVQGRAEDILYVRITEPAAFGWNKSSLSEIDQSIMAILKAEKENVLSKIKNPEPDEDAGTKKFLKVVSKVLPEMKPFGIVEAAAWAVQIGYHSALKFLKDAIHQSQPADEA